jgi:phage shock protein PspC (stress-responsive transcriptional regulator)
MNFYRSKDENILIGVCSGLADKYDLNLMAVRLFFVIMHPITIFFYPFGLAFPKRSTKSKTENKEIDDDKKDYEMKVVGSDAEIELYEKKIKFIYNSGLFTRFRGSKKPDKEIPIEKITSIKLKEQGIDQGYIIFEQSGHDIYDEQPVLDENSLSFANDKIEQVKELKRRINEKRKNIDTKKSIESESDTLSPIEQLKERYAQGEISEEEYDKKLEKLKE